MARSRLILCLQIKKEGESIEMKCRLEEDYEEGEWPTMTWYHHQFLIHIVHYSGSVYVMNYGNHYQQYLFTLIFLHNGQFDGLTSHQVLQWAKD